MNAQNYKQILQENSVESLKLTSEYIFQFAQSVGAVEYIDCFSAER